MLLTRKKTISKRFKIIVSSIVVIVAIVSFIPYFLYASFSTFTPSTCLGGWQNTKGAEGIPEIKDNSNLDLFNETNSAYLTNAVSQIFCGNFEGKLPSEATPKSITMKLSWAVKSNKDISAVGPVENLNPEASGSVNNTFVSDQVEEAIDVNEDLSSSAINSEFEKAKLEAEKNIAKEDEVSSGSTTTESSSEESIEETVVENTEEVNTDPVQDSVSQQDTSSEPAPVQVSEPVPTVEPEQTPAPTSETVSAPEPTPTPVSSPEPTTQSILHKFSPFTFLKSITSIAYAAEIDDSVSGSTTETISITESGIVDTIESTSSIETSSDSEEKIDEKIEEEQISQIVDTRPALPEPLFTILYTLDGNTWKKLGTVVESEIGKKDFDIPMDGISVKEDIKNIQINIQSNSISDQDISVYLDGITLEVQYDTLSQKEINDLPRVQVDSSEIFKSENEDFNSKEEAFFEINLGDDLENDFIDNTSNSVSTTTDSIDTTDTTDTFIENTSTSTSIKSQFNYLGSFFNNLTKIFTGEKLFAGEFAKKKVLKAEVFGPDGQLYTSSPSIEEVNGKVKINVPRKSDDFRPGLYKMVVEVLSNDKVLVTTQNFTWGVLAINTDKSSYKQGDQVYLQIGALYDTGHAICDANLELRIQSPSGNITTLSTNDGTIKDSTTCSSNNVTDNPDHYAFFSVEETGVYKMILTNLDKGYSVNDTFISKLEDERLFVVEREAATRINPFASTYLMKLRVLSNKDFDGDVVETIPQSFVISSTTDNVSATQSGNSQKIRWHVNLKKGEYVDLSYVYQAPMISPELYILGSVSLEQGGSSVYAEERVWQLASDAACNAITTGNWNDGTKWSGCSGAGGVPDATDDVTINSGVIMTVTANASVKSIVVAVNATGASTNGININSGITLTVGGNVTMNMPTSLTSTIDVGAGNLVAVDVTIPGSATSNRNATISLSTGTITLSGSVIFSGSASRARFIVTDSGTLNLAGNFGAGGTLTTTSHGTINFNGSSAQTMAGYATYNNVEINNTSGGVSILSNTTILGTLNVNSGTLTMAGVTLTVTGAVSVSGVIEFTSATGVKTFNSSITVNNGGTWSETANPSMTIKNGITNNGTFTAGTGIHTFSTNAQTINGSSSPSIPKITVTTITLTVDVDLSIPSTGALVGTGNLTMSANRTLTLAITPTITTLTVNGSGVVVDYNSTGAQTIKATTYNTLKINNTNTSGAKLGGATTLTTLTIGDLNPNSIFLDNGITMTLAGSSVLNLVDGTYKLGLTTAATNFPSFGTLNIATGTTVLYQATVAQNISATPTYYNLSFTGASTKTAQGSLTVLGDMTLISTTPTVDLSTYTGHTVYGNIVITSGTLNANTSTLTSYGDFSGAGTFTSTGVVNFVGGNTQSIGVTNKTLNTVNVDKIVGTTVAMTTNTTINGTLSVNTGTFEVGAITLTQNGTTSVTDTITITSSTGTKIFVGLVTINSGGVWNNSGNEAVTFRGGLVHNGSTFTSSLGVYTFDTNNQSISGSSPVSIDNVTVTGITLTNSLAAGLTVGTALSGTGELLQDTNSLINIGDPGTVGITTITAMATNNTVNYTGTAAQTVKATTYHHLGLSGAGVATLTGLTTVNGDMSISDAVTCTTAAALTIGGNLYVGLNPSSASLMTIGAYDFTVIGTTSVYGTLAHSSATGVTTHTGLVTIQPNGSWTNVGNSAFTFQGGLTHNGSTFSAGTGVYTFDTNNQSIGGSSALDIPNITVTGVTLTNNNTSGLTSSVNLSGTGGLTQGINSLLYISGTSGISTLTADASGNTVGYTNTTANQDIKNTTYYNLIIDKSSYTANIINSPLVVDNNLSISSGILYAPSKDIHINGNWTNSGTLDSTGTVVFNSTNDQTINGSTSWYGLSIFATSSRTIYFESGATQSVLAGGSITMTGTVGNLLSLSPLTASTSWYLNVNSSATQNISYVLPSYSDASSGYPIIATDVTDGGNNLNWGGSSVSCSTNIATTTFGTLSAASVSTASQNATTTLTCGSTGCVLYVHSQGNTTNPGLYAPAATSTPIILSSTATLSAGTEGYGIQAATSTSGSGANFYLNALYEKTGNDVGGLSTTDVVIASSSSALTDREIVVIHKASVSPITQTGSYSDVITYSCLAN